MKLEIAIRKDKIDEAIEAIQPYALDWGVSDKYPQDPFYGPTLIIRFSWQNVDHLVKVLHMVLGR